MSGYIGTQPVPQATQKRQAFTATAGQTTFATSGYSVGFVDVYMNGVKLAAADYTATNGSDVVLATAALVNDIIEIVAFTSFVVNSGLLTTGGTMTGNLAMSGANITLGTSGSGSDDRIALGASAHGQIYHDGTNFLIQETGSGNLLIDGTNISFRSAAAENYISCVADGAVSLYYDNAVKLATTSTGVDVTGNATFADNGKAIFGAGSDLQVYHDGSDSYVDDAGTGTLNLRGSDFVIISRPDGSATAATFDTNGPVGLRYNNSTKLETTASGISVTGTVKPTTYQETYVAKSAASTVTCDLATGTSFSVTLDQNTTFAFTNPPSSGTAFSFTLFITQHSTAVTLTWPGTVDWAGGSAPDAAAANEVQAYGFFTRDGGTTYYGFLGGSALG